MSDFRLLHGNKSIDPTRRSYVVAVEPCPTGPLSWTDRKVMGHDCATAEDWDELIDRLIKSLQRVRRQGQAKLADDDRVPKRHA
jgi:hypothetical protein